MRGVMTVMREHAISQMPVVGADGALVGLIDEVDLLNHMLEHEDHLRTMKIDSLVQHARAVYPPEFNPGRVHALVDRGICASGSGSR